NVRSMRFGSFGRKWDSLPDLTLGHSGRKYLKDVIRVLRPIIGTTCTFGFGTDGTGKREVRGSGGLAESGTKGPFELGTFGTKSSG
ncbi:hypothetical protein KI387_008419, partial [Taxus chinensis]